MSRPRKREQGSVRSPARTRLRRPIGPEQRRFERRNDAPSVARGKPLRLLDDLLRGGRHDVDQNRRTLDRWPACPGSGSTFAGAGRSAVSSGLRGVRPLASRSLSGGSSKSPLGKMFASDFEVLAAARPPTAVSLPRPCSKPRDAPERRGPQRHPLSQAIPAHSQPSPRRRSVISKSQSPLSNPAGDAHFPRENRPRAAEFRATTQYSIRNSRAARAERRGTAFRSSTLRRSAPR